MKGIAAKWNSLFGYRYIRTRDQRDIDLRILGIPVRILYTPRFDKRSDGTRAVALISLDYKTTIYSLLWQHYREGFEFDKHTDGIAENLVLTLVLRRPLEGGEFFVNGPMQSWLKGRIVMFDGGRYDHGVTKITKGSRSVLMFQRGKWRD